MSVDVHDKINTTNKQILPILQILNTETIEFLEKGRAVQ